mmetsp:Transcript_5057/g.11228  ORF Transcript_5057/g.11228 Transcript_5057/m.11228 type:complete len:201 (+) Transcript_5057:1342-1944(+)
MDGRRRDFSLSSSSSNGLVPSSAACFGKGASSSSSSSNGLLLAPPFAAAALPSSSSSSNGLLLLSSSLASSSLSSSSPNGFLSKGLLSSFGFGKGASSSSSSSPNGLVSDFRGEYTASSLVGSNCNADSSPGCGTHSSFSSLPGRGPSISTATGSGDEPFGLLPLLLLLLSPKLRLVGSTPPGRVERFLALSLATSSIRL